MNDPVPPALVIAHALRWTGTPFVRGAALRGAGCDCVGLVRGVLAELSGVVVAPPPWRDDWAFGKDQPILRGLMRHMIPVPPRGKLRPGHVVVWRIGPQCSGHVGILADHGILHASERAGVTMVPHMTGLSVTSAFAFPAGRGLTGGDPVARLTAADCLAVVYPPDAQTPGHHVGVTRAVDGLPVLRSAGYPTRADALAMAAPIYPHIETVE